VRWTHAALDLFKRIGFLKLVRILQQIPDNDAECVNPQDMLSELREDDKALLQRMRAVHALVR
jgi:hypothetical protein